MAAVPDLSSYVGSYKTIGDATAAIQNGTFAAANPYAVGSTNYNNYGNPGAFGTPQTYAMYNPAPAAMAAVSAQQASADATRASNGASNSASNSGIAAPQMAIPMAANNNADLARSIIGGTPQTPAPIDNSNAARNIIGGTPNATTPYAATATTAAPPVNTPPQVSIPKPVVANQQFQYVPKTITSTPSTTAAPTPRTDAEISAYVQQQIAASLGITQSAATQAIAQGQTAASQQLGAIKTQYDQNQANNTEDRNLQNFQDAQKYDPYGGGANRYTSLRDFARERTDREASQALTTNQNNVNQNLTDLQNKINAGQKALVDASPAEAAKLEQSLQNDRNNLQLQLRTADRADLTAQQQQTQNDFNNQLGTFNANLNAQNQSAIQTGKNADGTLTAAQNNANATNSGYSNPSNMTADQINQQIAKNSAAYANADTATKEQLHTQNVYLNGLLGKTDTTGNGDYSGGNPNGAVGYPTVAKQTLDFNQQQATIKQSTDIADNLTKTFGKQVIPNKDPMLMYAQVAGLATLDAQKFAKDVASTTFDEGIKKALADNTITQTQATILTQAQNANSSSLSASTGAANGAASRDNMANDNTRADKAASAKTYQDTFDNLKSLYTAKDPDTGTIKVSNPTALRSSIIAKGMPDAETIQMLAAFGLPIK